MVEREIYLLFKNGAHLTVKGRVIIDEGTSITVFKGDSANHVYVMWEALNMYAITSDHEADNFSASVN